MIEPLTLLRAVWCKGSPLTQRERAYLTALILRANNATGEAFPSQVTLAAEAGSNARSGFDVLPLLEQKGVIRRTMGVRSKTTGKFDVTEYEILPEAILAIGRSCRRQILPVADPTVGRMHNLPTAEVAEDLLLRGTASQREDPAPVVAAPIRGSKSSKKADAIEPSEHKRVVDSYFALYRSVRGIDPTFTGRQGSAVKALIKAKGSADAAIACLEIVYADPFWRGKATIVGIAGDPDKFTGKAAPTGGPRRVEVQQATAQDLDDHEATQRKLRALQGGKK